MKFDSEGLNEWFKKIRRPFPWRASSSPYNVWISEIMLQQTRANVVIPFFNRWMQKLPTIEEVARAPLDSLLKLWEGLGYYHRVRMLSQSAKIISNQYRGQFPSTEAELLRLPGIGPYTAAAILAFGFKKRAAPCDGNVMRVLCRLFEIEEEWNKISVKKKLQQLALDLLSLSEPWVTAEALIEMGATICKGVPLCTHCPLVSHCASYKNSSWNRIPRKAQKKESISLKRAVLVIESKGKILIKRNERGRVMADLYEFPYFGITDINMFSRLQEIVKRQWMISIDSIQMLSPVKQTFTKFRALLFPFRAKSKEWKKVKGFVWWPKHSLSGLVFSSGHRAILTQLGLEI